MAATHVLHQIAAMPCRADLLLHEAGGSQEAEAGGKSLPARPTNLAKPQLLSIVASLMVCRVPGSKRSQLSPSLQVSL